jgi:hypothetical protein
VNVLGLVKSSPMLNPIPLEKVKGNEKLMNVLQGKGMVGTGEAGTQMGGMFGSSETGQQVNYMMKGMGAVFLLFVDKKGKPPSQSRKLRYN